MPTPDTGTLPGTALETIGTVLTSDQGRDAIHLATKAVMAGETLYPNQPINIDESGEARLAIAGSIGVVDPFLLGPVHRGQMFWLVLYPRTITSLRHHWTHPAFDDDEPVTKTAPVTDKAVSEAWLREFCSSHDCPSYETLLGAFKGEWPGDEGDRDYLGFQWGGWDGDSLHFEGIDAHSDIPSAFWDHVSVVLGKDVPSEKRASYFTCSC